MLSEKRITEIAIAAFGQTQSGLLCFKAICTALREQEQEAFIKEMMVGLGAREATKEERERFGIDERPGSTLMMIDIKPQ